MMTQSPWPVRLIAGITALNGIFSIAEVLITRLPHRIELLLPFDYDSAGRHVGLLAGFILLYISLRLLDRKYRAWQVAFGASFMALLGNALYVHAAGPIIVSALSIGVLFAFRHSFSVASEPISIRRAAILFVMSLVVAVVYGTLGFYLLMQRDFGQQFGIVEAVERTLQAYSLVGNTDLIPQTREAHWFLDSLNLFGLMTLVIGIVSLFRPLTYRFATLPRDRYRAKLILERYGNDSEDSFKLWPEDKTYFFSSSGQAFMAYRVAAGVAVVLGEPTGPESERLIIVEQFSTYAHAHGWTVALLYVSGAYLTDYAALGFRSFMIGQDAIVSTDDFTAKTRRNKHFRAIMNKFSRLKYDFAVLRAPQSRATIRRLNAINRRWLARAKHQERAFALGYFDREHLEHSDIAVIYDADQRIIAFANLIDSFDPARASIDLMRYEPNQESGLMDYLLASLIGWLDDEKIAEFSLGLAPLTGSRTDADSILIERFVQRVAQNRLSDFSFLGLRRFKQKFQPTWYDRYLIFEGSLASLGIIAYAIDNVMKHNRSSDELPTNTKAR